MNDQTPRTREESIKDAILCNTVGGKPTTFHADRRRRGCHVWARRQYGLPYRETTPQ